MQHQPKKTSATHLIVAVWFGGWSLCWCCINPISCRMTQLGNRNSVRLSVCVSALRIFWYRQKRNRSSFLPPTVVGGWV